MAEQKCLVTKLKSSVSDDSIPKLGRLVLELTALPGGSPFFTFGFSKDCDIEVLDGSVNTVITDGKIHFEANINQTFYYSERVVLSIPKYLLVVFNNAYTDISKVLDLSEFKYNDLPYTLLRLTSNNSRLLKGDVANLANSRLNGLSIISDNVYGDLTPLFESSNKTGLWEISCNTFEKGKYLIGDASHLFAPGNTTYAFIAVKVGISLNLNNDSDLSKLTTFTVSECRYNSPTSIEFLNDMSGLTAIPTLKGSNFCGDVSNFNALLRDRSKVELVSNIAGNNFSGDIAVLEDRFTVFSSMRITFEDGSFAHNTGLRWTAENRRPASAYVLALEGVILATPGDVDNMLINQANCRKREDIDQGLASWKKNIQVFGTRTSRSDAAVQQLQAWGYIVDIRPIPDYVNVD